MRKKKTLAVSNPLLFSFHSSSRRAAKILAIQMERWNGVLKVSLNPNRGPPFFKVAASLLLTPLSKTLAVPSVNAIFFNGDHVKSTGNPIIERLSDLQNIAQLLVDKLGAAAATNAWVVDASTFNGPFAVYKELIPSVNSRGEPKRYDPDGFPASSSIVAILSECIQQVKNEILSGQDESKAAEIYIPEGPTISPPKTLILGFSKGGTVVNQIVTEFAHLNPDSAENSVNNQKPSGESCHEFPDHICPSAVDSFLSSISEFNYVDVGLNCSGAYLTDPTVIKKIALRSLYRNIGVCFAFHGTPRQWCDSNRPWIGKEKDIMRQLLEHEAHVCEGKLLIRERFYFADSLPNLQMHFEIIESLDIG